MGLYRDGMQRPARRHIEASAITALAPIVAVLPVWLLAIIVWWLPFHLIWDTSLPLFALAAFGSVVVLFLRPVQVHVLAPLLGARPPDRHETTVLAPAWRPVLQALGLPDGRYVIAVLPANELNAFACGGHLLVVTSYAIETLPRDELSGVLAHELSHHLGFHTVALTIGQWLSIPVLLLARIGFFLQNVASAAIASWGNNSPALTVLGRLFAAVLTAVSWVFLSALVLSNALANAVAHASEFQADRRAVQMGFGKPLSLALRRVAAEFGTDRPRDWRDRLAASHPPARTRIARIDALLRQR